LAETEKKKPTKNEKPSKKMGAGQYLLPYTQSKRRAGCILADQDKMR
jgi:hypothetical protein